MAIFYNIVFLSINHILPNKHIEYLIIVRYLFRSGENRRKNLFFSFHN